MMYDTKQARRDIDYADKYVADKDAVRTAIRTAYGLLSEIDRLHLWIATLEKKADDAARAAPR